MAKLRTALQMYTVRNTAEKDMNLALKKAKDIGYDAVELAGFGNLTPDQMLEALDTLKITPVASHVSLVELETNLDGVIRDQKTIRNPVVVCPYLPEERRKTAEDYRKLAEFFNQTSAALEERDMRFVYHHHDFELEDLGGGESGMDILLKETNPDRVSFEVDIYWLAFSGLDPAEWLRANSTRVSMVHLKDMTPAPRTFAPLGEGTLKLDAVITAGKDLPIDWWIVEQDETAGSPFDSIKTSYDYLKTKGHI